MTQDEIKTLLHYNASTGLFVWTQDKRRPKKGSIAGYLNDQGYVCIILHRKIYRAHRLAWLYAYGEWPPRTVDHINHIRHDNRLENLRLASQAEQVRHASVHAHKKSGLLKGVTPYRYGAGGFIAQIYVRGVHKYLGIFDNEQDAHEAYCDEAKKQFGEYFFAG